MAVTDTDATERVEPEPLAAQDPSLSPVVDHGAVTTHSPVPKVVAHRAPATPADQVSETRQRGVKLAKISRTGDRIFRSLATSGLLIVLLVVFVGIFLSGTCASQPAGKHRTTSSPRATGPSPATSFASGSRACSGPPSVGGAGNGDGRPSGGRRCSLHDAVSAQASLGPGFLCRRSACRRAVDHLRPLGVDRLGPVPGTRRGVADQQAGLDTVLRKERRPQRIGLCRLGGTRHHDLANRDCDLP